MARAPVSVPDQIPQVAFDASGIAEDSFPFNWPYWEAGDLVVRTRALDEEWVIREDYSVTPTSGTASTGYPSGTVVFNAPIEDLEVWIRREKTFERIAQFPVGAALDLPSLNRDLNRLLGLQQTLRMLMDSFLRISDEDAFEDPECLTLPAKALRIEKMFAFNDVGCIALLPLPTSVRAVFHPSTGDYTVAPDLPTGMTPWLDTGWTQYPDADSVWISFSLGANPAIDGWDGPIRFVGQSYGPNLYGDPTYAGPHSVTLPPGTEPENLPTTLVGRIEPSSFYVSLPNAGGPTDFLTFVDMLGTSTSWLWEWVDGGAGITIVDPALQSTELLVAAGQGTYSGTLRCTASDGVGLALRTVAVVIEVVAGTSGVPTVMTASLTPSSPFEVAFEDVLLPTTDYVVAAAAGGRAPYTYTWRKNGGSGNVNLSNVDSWAGDRMRFWALNPDPVAGGVISGLFSCTIYDSSHLYGYPQQVAVLPLTVQFTFTNPGTVDPLPPVLVSILPSSVNTTLPAPSQEPGGVAQTGLITGAASNTAGALTWLWEWASGGAGLTIMSPNAASTRLQAAADGAGYSGVLRLTVTDGDLRTGSNTIPVSVATAGAGPALTATMSVAALARTFSPGYFEGIVGRATAFPAGGTLPYTFTWRPGAVLGGANVSIEVAPGGGGAWADFYAVPESNYGTVSKTQRFYCDVRDAGNKLATVFVDVSATFQGQTGGGDETYQPF